MGYNSYPSSQHRWTATLIYSNLRSQNVSPENGIRAGPGRLGRGPTALLVERSALTALCVLVALVPLAFGVVFFEPYLTTKEALVQAGAPTIALLGLITTCRGSPTLARTPMWIPLFGLALAVGISTLWSSHPRVSIEAVERLSLYSVLFAVALHQMRQARARAMLASALMAAGAIEAAYVLFQFSLGDPIFVTDRLVGKWRTFGTLGNPDWTGEFLAVTALIALGRFVGFSNATSSAFDAERKRPRVSAEPWTLLALILMLLALMATLARGAWLAFLVAAGLFLVVRRRYSYSQQRSAPPVPYRRTLSAIALTGAAAIVWSLLGNHRAINNLLDLKSLRGRLWMWAVTWTMIKDAPWRGHGLGTLGLTFPLYQGRAFSHEWAAPFVANASFTSYAHNDYLQLWGESGLFALLAFAALVWIAIRRGRELASDAIALGSWAALVSLLVNSVFAFPLHLPTSLMSFMVLLGTVEGAACKRTWVTPVPAKQARIAMLLPVLVLCFIAYRSSYHMLAGDAALLRAGDAIARQDWNEAESSALNAIHNAPERLEGYSMLGQTYLERGEYQQALGALDKASKLGFDTQVFDLKATALERSGQPAAAIATLNELAWLRPDLSWPQQRLSVLSIANKIHAEHKP